MNMGIKIEDICSNWEYSLGYELGYEKGFVDGSILGYNNGFLTALRVMEESDFSPDGKISKRRVWQALKKLVAEGALSISLSGCAARDAENLLKHLGMKVNAVEPNKKTD